MVEIKDPFETISDLISHYQQAGNSRPNPTGPKHHRLRGLRGHLGNVLVSELSTVLGQLLLRAYAALEEKGRQDKSLNWPSLV